ncbi:MAG: ATP-grasp domain-containing protein, partial [SAR202 cluster bacterium]|nr:ATP-grasp domain-containing protein [SAR202 cluster bacterium]
MASRESEHGPILPGATIGILGGGQLGRMMAIAARRMGYRVAVLDPTQDCPAAQVADHHIAAAYDDTAAAAELAHRSAVVTIEFENIPAGTLEAIEPLVTVHPSSTVVRVCQHRIREKTFLAEHGIPTATFRSVTSLDTFRRGIREIGVPAVLKTASGGYDGKGQWKLGSERDADAAWKGLAGREAIVEEFVQLEKELSVIVARDP